MRNIIRPGVLALACLGLGAGSARAAEVVVSVPFPFMVGTRVMPAGEYTVDRLDRDPSVMLIKSSGQQAHAAAIVEVDPAYGQDPAGDQPALTFTHRGNQYQLSAIWESRVEGQDVWESSIPRHINQD